MQPLDVTNCCSMDTLSFALTLASFSPMPDGDVRLHLS